jgi:hypothetical protein
MNQEARTCYRQCPYLRKNACGYNNEFDANSRTEPIEIGRECLHRESFEESQPIDFIPPNTTLSFDFRYPHSKKIPYRVIKSLNSTK